MGGFSAIMGSKEFFITGGHDMFEAILLWSIFGTVASVASDWYAWWHTLLMQESYDRKYFPLLRAVKKYNKMLENFNQKPNEKKLAMQMGAYREMVAEKVLDKTLGNRLGRIVESTVSKLEAKVSEESMVRKTAEDQWKRTALQETVDYFDDESCAATLCAMRWRSFALETLPRSRIWRLLSSINRISLPRSTSPISMARNRNIWRTNGRRAPYRLCLWMRR